MDADVPVVESGGKTDFQYGSTPGSLYPAVKVDRVLHDGDEVRLGGTVLVAHLTPGHTRGCTTWTMKVQEGGKTYDAVIVGSPNVNAGYTLVGNKIYPEIATDYERTFKVLKSLPCDLFLGAHGDYFNLTAKYARLKGGGTNPFVDPDGYKKYVAERERAFRRELARQLALANARSDGERFPPLARRARHRRQLRVELAPDLRRRDVDGELREILHDDSRPDIASQQNARGDVRSIERSGLKPVLQCEIQQVPIGL
jgi:glyoxylase-like metal-dependent hydrolase (beta-lactamase superfamily II)